MSYLTPEQTFTLTHLGIERWAIRTWPMQSPEVMPPQLWVVHEISTLDDKAMRLLVNLLRSVQLEPKQVRVISKHEMSTDSEDMPQVLLLLGVSGLVLKSEIKTVSSFSLSHLLMNPADKKQAFIDLLQVKQWLLPCDQLV